MPSPAASVIVCVHNRPDAVRSCLQSLARLEFQGSSVVVVDDGSTDGTPEALADFRDRHPELDLTIVRNPRNLGVSGARNAGLPAARGDVVAFTDSDCTVEPGWLGALVAAFDRPEVGAVGGRVIDAAPRTWAERAYVGTCRTGAGRLQRRDVVGNNMAFRRAAAGLGFDPALIYGCDEDELVWRLESLGWQTRFAPAAVVRHDHALTVAAYLRQAARQGEGSARFWYKRGSYLGRDVVAPLATVAALPLGLLGAPWLAVPGALLALTVALVLVNEARWKGKGLGEAVAVLPLALLHLAVKSASVVRTLVRIAAGREPAIAASKRRWREQAAGRANDGAAAVGWRSP